MSKIAKITILSHVNLEPITRFGQTDSDPFEWVWDGFNTLIPQLILEAPRFHQTRSDIVWIHIDPNYPGLLESLPWEWKDESAFQADWSQILSCIEKAVTSFPEIAFLISNVNVSAYSPFPMISGTRRHRINQALNEPIRNLCAQHPNTSILDISGLQQRIGEDHWKDQRLWYIGNIPYSRLALDALKKLLSSHLRSFTRPPAKVIAVDLDNTLWGGTIDAMTEFPLELGPAGLGLAFRTFQDILLSLTRAGILLVVISKNDEQTALEMINAHSHMRIRERHLATYRISWSPKSRSLENIASELGLPLSSFIVLDDDPRERAEIAMHCPDALVAELPSDPADRPEWLMRDLIPEHLAITRFTETDANRTESYQRRKHRDADQSVALDENSFLQSLQMRVEVNPPSPKDWSRLSQLTVRTNQFNLNGKVRDPASMQTLCSQAGWRFWAIHYADRYGDEGIVGAVATSFEDSSGILFVQIFCLSCRVLEKRVEHVSLHKILQSSKHLLPMQVCLQFSRTGKNGRMEVFLESLGISLDTPLPTLGYSTLMQVLNKSLP